MKPAIAVRDSVQRMRAYHPPLEGRTDKLRLDFNENPIGCSPAVRRSLAKLTAASISAYPEQETVRKQAARHFGVRPDELLLTNGTDEALSLVVNVFVEAGDRVLLVEPTYAMYRFYSELAGAQIVALHYDAEMRFPWNEVLEELRRRPRVLFLPNPNSPTGQLLSLAELRRILKAAPRTMVVIDEAYFEFCGVTVIPWIRRYENLIVTRTFSKTCGLAGLRLGCLFVRRELAAQMRKAQSPYPVNVAALAAAEAAMRDRGFIARTVREVVRGREELRKGLAKLGVRCFPSAGNFVLTYFGDRAKPVVAALERKGILVRDRSSDFAGEGYVRITLGTLPQTRRLLRELKAIL
ncbi:MAG TPA: histidinol-phosphate transaminase [Candidatus Dormibacteraeota bacterium]|nr:histidinol-phosphate transaminase [Candidatus Dormibacteraeota bacterium]